MSDELTVVPDDFPKQIPAATNEETVFYTRLTKKAIQERSGDPFHNCQLCGLAFMEEQECLCGWKGDGSVYQKRHCLDCHQEAIRRGLIQK